MEQSNGWNIISVYTRKQAIDDGVLIDVTHLARITGFTLHTVISATLLHGLPPV